MNIFTHIVAVLVLAKAMSLNSSDLLIALVFGVGVDIDHLLKLPLYFSLPKSKRKRHLNWRTPLQEPISLLWVAPLSIYLSSFVPVIFFSLHLLLDYLMSYSKRPFFPYSNLKMKGAMRLKKDRWLQIGLTVVLCIFLIF